MHQRVLQLSEDGGENAQSYRELAAFLEQSPLVSALAQAENLNQQVIELYQQGRYTEAIPLAKQSLVIREQVLRPKHPDTALSRLKIM